VDGRVVVGGEMVPLGKISSVGSTARMEGEGEEE